MNDGQYAVPAALQAEIVKLRKKIARWHLALQQRRVDREWPALEIIMREMGRESNTANDVTKKSAPHTDDVSCPLQKIVDLLIQIHLDDHHYAPRPVPDQGIVAWYRIPGENPCWIGYSNDDRQLVTVWEHQIDRVLANETIPDPDLERLIRCAFEEPSVL